MSGMGTATLSKCYDCVVPTGYACPHQSIDTAASAAAPGWVLGTFDASTHLDPDQALQDLWCAERRADPNVNDPALATERTKRLKNQAAIMSNGAIFAVTGTTDYWVLGGDLFFGHGPEGPGGGDATG